MDSRVVPCPVGYVLSKPTGGFAFRPPQGVIARRSRPLGQRAIQNCPAVNSLERQLIELAAPIGIRLRLEEEPDGPSLAVVPTGSFAEPEAIAELVALEPPELWRHPGKPVLTLTMPFFLVTDEPCVASLLPPFFEAAMRRWPGQMIPRRWPLTLWPETPVWTFEWDDPAGELVLRQGEPLAYVLCEFNHPAKRPELVEAALTPELAEWRAGMAGVQHITDRIDEIWEEARARRPRRLLVPLAEAIEA